MKIVIKDTSKGEYKISVPIYNRGDCLGIDYENGNKQILITEVTIFQAKRMIKEIENYIANYENNA